MKIEKINSNQIKCVLNKSDLVSRQIKVSELAYGTEKAQELFKDMMSQASNEFGFEADDTPLMIEAVPLSAESIMLIITKVDDPDDIEDKFNNLPVPQARTFKKKDSENETPDPQEEPAANLLNPPSVQKEDLIDVFYVYSFTTLDDASHAADKIHEYTFSTSKLFKDRNENLYYLTINAEKIPRWANRVIRGTLSEYGDASHYRNNSISYFDEHFDPIIKEDAVEILTRL